MKAANFQYHAPTSVDEALAMLREHGGDAKVLAGGQSLVPVLALRLTRFEHLIDLNRIDDLAYIHPDGGSLSVGAMTRQSTAEHSDDVKQLVPLLARALPLIGHFQIRNRGTIGGSIAHGDPASELPAVACAVGAEIEVRGDGETRRIPASDFFVSTWETAIGPDEIVTSIGFPGWGMQSGFAIEEFALRQGDFAITGAACALSVGSSGQVDRVAIALMGMGATPIRAADAELAIVGRAPSELDLKEISRISVESTNPTDDVHASGNYRKHVCAILVRRALGFALEEASRG